MNERYTGNEPCTSTDQVVRYLTQNYTGADGQPMPRTAALAIVKAGADKIDRGINLFRSNVYYLGDEALQGTDGWTYIPDPDDPEDDD
jgi:hypothetical protein